MLLSSPPAMAHATSLWLNGSGRLSTERSGEIAQRWMEMVLGEKFSQGFPKVLLSGEWLCALANKLFQALGMRDRSCASIKTSWPSALSSDSLVAASVIAVSGSVDEINHVDERRSSERMRMHRASSSGDIWLQQKQIARENVEEYLRACEVIGVLPQDIFQPEDLLELQNLDKVYHNILALQGVAVRISHRRSIDDRSSASMSVRPSVSVSPDRPMVLSSDSLLSARSSVDVTKEEAVSWAKLLSQYEKQQLKNATMDQNNAKGLDPSQTEGLGQLAHDIWRTEEHIRAMLLRDDGNAVPVPDVLHGKLWVLASGAGTEMRRRKGQYQKYVAMEVESTDSTRQIDADLHRTVGDDDKLTWNEAKTTMMRRVLVAYSFFNPTLGYCQGLNYIVARLLLFVEEEEAFYLLTKMLRLVPDDYYTTMLGLAVDQHVFADLVRLQAPTVAKHLEELGGSGMELSLACTEWFLTLFSSPCAKEVTVRVWDLIFLTGDEILFRVALALLDLEKDTLMKCNTYGDMLRHLNEIGRRETDAGRLMIDAQKKETVSRLRIDDFRAHHRLQLATGIAVQSAEESSEVTANASADGKEEAKAKLFGSKKRPGLFKQVDKNAGRVHRTFDRHLTDDYTVSLQKEHPTFSCYYDGRPPIVFENYWGSTASQTVWGKRNYRRITEINAAKEPKEERRRLQSDGAGLAANQRIPDEEGGLSGGRSGQARERRSKSIAFIQPNKKGTTSESVHQQIQQGKKPTDEENQYSRSPKGWLQRLEGWHKDLKIQKEKKKADKMKSRRGNGQLDGEPNSAPARGGYVRPDRSQNHTFSAPTWRHIDDSDEQGRVKSFETPTNTGMGMGKGRPEKRSESMDVNVSTRSHSDPYLSPNEILLRTRWREPSMDDDMDKVRSQESDKVDFSQSMGPTPQRRRSSSQLRGESIFGRSSDLGHRETIKNPTNPHPQRSSKTMSFSTMRLNAFDLDATDDSRLSFDMGKPPGPVISDMSAPAAGGMRRVPTNGSRTVSADIDDDKIQVDAFNSLSQPSIRRNQSLPLTDSGAYMHYQQQQLHNQQQFYTKHMRKVAPETARVMRERAQVLSYMQRKASDASSLTLTPGDQNDILRLSTSSSDSSRYSEFMLPTSRSTKSMIQPPTNLRKSSFSFFDKLSSDVETQMDDLHGSFIDNDTDNRDSFDSSIFSRTWSPSSAHQKILAATAMTD